jgi:hypothetical protein
VHVRRVLLLFAIVLGLAALAAAVSQPRQSAQERPAHERPTHTAVPGPAGEATAEIEFPARSEGRPPTRRLSLGRSATLVVEVPRPGEVTVEGLGVVSAADPLTPARFELFGGQAGRHRVRFTPAGQEEAVTLGTLAIVSD